MDKKKEDETKKLPLEDKPKNKEWKDIVILVGAFSSIILTIVIVGSFILTLYKIGPMYRLARRFAKACKEDLRRLSPRGRSPRRTSPLIPTVDTVNLSRGWFG
jgi:hypothetical protein